MTEKDLKEIESIKMKLKRAQKALVKIWIMEPTRFGKDWHTQRGLNKSRVHRICANGMGVYTKNDVDICNRRRDIVKEVLTAKERIEQ